MQGVLIFFIGLICGSFGNVLIERLPKGETLFGRSQCRTCRRILCWFELIPICGYLFLGGRCRTCRKSISWQYPLVEFVSGMLFVISFNLIGKSLFSASALAFALWLFFLIVIIDAKYQCIPDVLNISFVLFSAVYSIAIGQMDFLGIAIGGGWFMLQWIVSRGRFIGSGDIILGVGIGALLGSWQRMILCLFFAYIIGACVSVFLIVIRRKTSKDHIAFAPFLGIGTALTMFFGSGI